jgi:endonuclease YncB( thermonuclease family)
VVHNDRSYIFRLYFVDTPESDPSLRERIQDQAAYFGISNGDIPRGATMASKLVRDRLKQAPFTVVTRWQNAGGRSQLARFYGIVLVNGERMEEELVRTGMARIYGLRANWPAGTRSTTYINKLKNLELQARLERRGLWNTNDFPTVTNPGEPASRKVETSVVTAETPLDPNTATYEELQKLPGIGPVLSERIMAHRPYRRIEDVDAVPGIGPVTFGRIRPLLKIQETSPEPDQQ